MDSDTLYLVTSYNKEGKRVGIGVSNDLEGLQNREKSCSSGWIVKFWECKEIKVGKIKVEKES